MSHTATLPLVTNPTSRQSSDYSSPLVEIRPASAAHLALVSTNPCGFAHTGLCRVCHADVYAMVESGEITWESLGEMGLKGLGDRVDYLVGLDRELKQGKAVVS